TFVRTGAMAHRLREPIAQLEAALVAECDGIPSARLEDDQLVRRAPAGEVPGPARAALFLDGPNDREAVGRARRLPGHGRDRGRQRSLGVDRAAAEELIPRAPYRDEARNRIDMSQEHHLAWPTPPEGDDVARFFASGRTPDRTKPRHEPLDDRTPLSRRARAREHLFRQFHS